MTRDATPGYDEHIATALRNSGRGERADARTIALVEDFMRAEHGTLDALTARQFASAALRALADIEAADAALGKGFIARYCETSNLAVPRWILP